LSVRILFLCSRPEILAPAQTPPVFRLPRAACEMPTVLESAVSIEVSPIANKPGTREFPSRVPAISWFN
jgi:hypothetical protein